ncbi:MAG: ester cyclase [Anaerolineales bacterium]|jgi:hypothetical protein
MASKLDFYNKYYDATWVNPPASIIEANEKYLSDDFHNLDKDGNIEGDKELYIGMSQLLFASFDDFNFVKSDVREEDDGVIITGHFEGKHTGDIDLSALGLGVIPASGKMVVWPESRNKFIIVDDKIVGIQSLDENGGVAAFMKALGVEMPSE